MVISPLCDHAAPGCPVDKAFFDEIGLVYILNGTRILADGRRQGVQSHRAAHEFLNHGHQNPPVNLIEAVAVHLQKIQRKVRDLLGDLPVVFDLGEITDPLEKPVGQTRRSPGTSRQLHGAQRVNLHAQHVRGTLHDGLQLLVRIEFQMMHHAEAIPQRRGQQSRPCRRANQRKMRQIQPDGPGRSALANHNIDGEILHGRVQHLLHLPVQPVNLVHEKHVALGQIIENRRDLARLLDGRSGGHLHVDAHLIGDNAGQGRLAQSRRAVKQHVIQGFSPGLGRLDIDFQIFLGLFLADIFIQRLRPQTVVCADILLHGLRCNDPFSHLICLLKADIF